MRSERRSKTIPELAKHLDQMATIVEHQRNKTRADSPTAERTRKVREAVAVVVFEEEDGTETVSVVGHPDLGALELKGVLHDGLYAMAHEGREGFSSE